MLSPMWMGSREFAKFVVENEKLFNEILRDLGLLK